MTDAELPRDTRQLRHHLHRHPEVSSREAGTAAIIARFMAPLGADAALEGLGGHGAAYVFEGPLPGPTVLVRCELDALPIDESLRLDHGSETPGVSHKCGHDGHMAIVAELAKSLSSRRPARGRAVLLFQPAEETGEGAARVLADPRFAPLLPDYAVALHNLPGEPLGRVLLRAGTFACASVGLLARLDGATSHAAEPEKARSPARALARLLAELPELPDELGLDALATITHARLGAATLGITPGEAELFAALRAPSDEDLGRLLAETEDRLHRYAESGGLEVSLERREPFRALVNDPDLVETVERTARDLGLETVRLDEPMRWSEDFAELTARVPGVLFGLGAGEDQPPLHSPAYDFPDALIKIGAGLFRRLVDELTEASLG